MRMIYISIGEMIENKRNSKRKNSRRLYVNNLNRNRRLKRRRLLIRGVFTMNESN